MGPSPALVLAVQAEFEAQLVGIQLGQRVSERGGAVPAVAAHELELSPHRLDRGEPQLQQITGAGGDLVVRRPGQPRAGALDEVGREGFAVPPREGP